MLKAMIIVIYTQLSIFVVFSLLLGIGYDSVRAAPPVSKTGVCKPFYTLALPVHVLHRVNQRKLVENNRANILRDFKFQTVKQLLASQPDTVMVDKEQKRAGTTDKAIPSDGNSIRKEKKRSRNTRN